MLAGGEIPFLDHKENLRHSFQGPKGWSQSGATGSKHNEKSPERKGMVMLCRCTQGKTYLLKQNVRNLVTIKQNV